MKILRFAVLVSLFTAISALAEERPVAALTFRATDESGQPLVGAMVKMSTFLRWQPGPNFGEDISSKVEAKTDDKGYVTLSQPSYTGEISYGVDEIPGFYRGGGGRHRFESHANSRWQPWNPTISIILRPILKPVPMYAKRINEKVPVFSTDIGYDLMVGDWVTPHGSGKTSDFIFYATLDKRDELDFDYTLTVKFASKGDGIQPFHSHFSKTSRFKSPRFAPENGYLAEWVQIRKRKPNKPEEGNMDIEGSRQYFFRVRTVLDDSGNIKSALYGKIYGDFMSFAYYLNPNTSDRNMEFDPQKNLFKDLSAAEKPQDP